MHLITRLRIFFSKHKLLVGLFGVLIIALTGFFIFNRSTKIEQLENVNQENLCTTTQTHKGYHTLWWYQPAYKDIKELDKFLNSIYSHNHCDELFLSISWADIEKQEGKYDFTEVEQRIDRILESNLRMYVILDAGTGNQRHSLTSIPNYIWSKYPECSVLDFYNTSTKLVSFLNKECVQNAYDFFETSARHLSKKYGEKIIAYQPTFNNEYEVRYAQFNYSWQDYSSKAAESFQEWLRLRNANISYWEDRWDLKFFSFDQIKPPIINYNQDTEPEVRQIYYDWQAFREEAIVEAYAKATDVVHRAGAKVIYHFGEWMTANDGISTAPLYPLLKKVELDYILIDSNLQDTKGNKNDPIIGAVLASAVKRINVPVSYEAAVERMDLDSPIDRNRITQSLALALREGISGIAITNLINPSLEPELLPPKKDVVAEKYCKIVLYHSRWQSYAFHGATTRSGFLNKDPVQERLFNTYKAYRNNGCVEIWDDEMVTDQNLAQVDTVVLSDAIVMKQSSLDMINAAERTGLKVIRSNETARYVLDNAHIFRAK